MGCAVNAPLPPPALLVAAVFSARREGEAWSVYFDGGAWRSEPGLPPPEVHAWYACKGCGAIDAAAGRARGERLRIARVVGGRVVLEESPGAVRPSKGE